MTVSTQHFMRSKIFTFLVLTNAAFFISSCAQKVAFVTSSVVPAAEGSVKVKKDKNQNYKIELNVKRLADPERLSPPKKIYIVWILTENNVTKNIGHLNTASGWFSSTLKSSLETVSAFKPAKIFVTAEDDAGILYPSGTTVLTTTDF